MNERELLDAAAEFTVSESRAKEIIETVKTLLSAHKQFRDISQTVIARYSLLERTYAFFVVGTYWDTQWVKQHELETGVCREKQE
jgi:hypothetical protein